MRQLLAGQFQTLLKEIDLLTGNANTVPDWFFRKIWRRKPRISPRRWQRHTDLLPLARPSL